ncbi:hypothetical protein BVY01_00875 [bacterium I07]|nr:hypothetical protein BVY01_00875 [bacterium I07]
MTIPFNNTISRSTIASIRTIVRWITRICSIALIIYLLDLWKLSALDTYQGISFARISAGLKYHILDISVIIGVILSWKWERLGGLILIGLIVVIAIIASFFGGSIIAYSPIAETIAILGNLFLFSWVLSMHLKSD